MSRRRAVDAAIAERIRIQHSVPDPSKMTVEEQDAYMNAHANDYVALDAFTDLLDIHNEAEDERLNAEMRARDAAKYT